MKALVIVALLVGCSSEGPNAPAIDAGSEDVFVAVPAPSSEESGPAPCERKTEVVVGDAVVLMPVPCRTFDPLTDLGRQLP